ncbi:right-handed parallel beta-helix repeat-containing protein [uncultured Algibacter sp.]|uniref:right-handed parallel beta-helix repeat-containing protein n=1 Tax=uncultured Algibacter sp. TaxID=298659 RepID=UPI0026115A22|nr:right-handed parallel beta-helix repeat-containing protein [uncultured Algibacter sp.]
MIKTKRVMLLAFVIMISVTSCNKEELFIEPVEEVVTDDKVEDKNEDKEEESKSDASLPCDFNLDNVEPNSTVIINCILDLGGSSVKLPEGITFLFEGGDIINGTLDLSKNTIISEEFLNATLTLIGSTPQIKDKTFNFIPERWGIVEGKVSDAVALNNRIIINDVIERTKAMSVTTFRIDKMDAYFNVEANKVNRKYSFDRSIRVPSNFHFEMSENTFLRVQPTHFPAYALITTMVSDNAIISGGNLIGDRWEHDYTPIYDIAGVNREEHGNGHLIWIIGAHNAIVDNVKISNAIGEGIQVHAETIRNPDGSLKQGTRTSENVLIKNCLITESRRNGIAIIDANGVVIDNCDIVDTGKGEQAYDGNGKKIFSSSGAIPKYGIDLEALRYINDDGTMNEINKIENVIIRNSRLTGNEFGDITLFTCSNVVIENNYFDKWVANVAANDITIRNNTFESRESGNFNAINIQSYSRGGVEHNYNYSITGNKIKNYANGISVAGKNFTIKNNVITDCNIGVFLKGYLYDAVFSENNIKSNLDVSYGYKCFNNAQNSNNISVSNEFVDVTNRPLSLIGFLSESSIGKTQISFDNCTFNTKSKNFSLYLNNAKNIEFKNNTSNTDFEIIKSENIVLTNNNMNN